MNLKTPLKIVWQSIKNNKTRTFLTILGMVVGVTSIMVVFSAGEGFKNLIVQQVESFGTDIIESEVRIPEKSKKGGTSDMETATAMAQGVQITTLTLDDVEDAIKLPNVLDGYGGIMGQELATHENKRKKIFLFGVSPAYINIDKSEVAQGRFFTAGEDKSLARVVVLGSKVKETLFADSDALGRFIKLGKSKYKVIGIMEERGAVMSVDFDEYIYIPVRTLQKRIMGIDYLMYMVHQIEDLSLADQTAEDIRVLLRENHDINNPEADTAKDDFVVYTMEEMMSMVDEITAYITLLLLAIVVVSLIVGGVGIMNIMYVIVSERTFEIGLRKAVGAKQKDILWQFLIEAIIIALIGALVGIVLGILIALLISIGANYYGLDWKLVIPLIGLIIAFSFSILSGLVFGVFPARKAAKMDPILALRKDM